MLKSLQFNVLKFAAYWKSNLLELNDLTEVTYGSSKEKWTTMIFCAKKFESIFSEVSILHWHHQYYWKSFELKKICCIFNSRKNAIYIKKIRRICFEKKDEIHHLMNENSVQTLCGKNSKIKIGQFELESWFITKLPPWLHLGYHNYRRFCALSAPPGKGPPTA